MSYQIIHKAIDDVVDTALSSEINGEFENQNLVRVDSPRTGVSSTPYYMSTFLPSQTQILTLGNGGTNRWLGLYQLDFFVPNDWGHKYIDWLADQIVAAFPANTYIPTPTPQLCLRPIVAYRLPGQGFTQWLKVPVVIEWEAYINR